VLFWKRNYLLKALDFFQKTISISKKLGNHFVTGPALTFHARCFLNLCDYKRAHEYLKRASKIYDTLGMKWRKSFLILDFGRISQAQGNYTLALKFYRSVLKISKERGDLNLIAISHLLISSVFIEMGGLSRARKYIEEAFKIMTNTKEKENEIVCYIELCRYNIITEEYRTANHYCQIGIKYAKEFAMKRQLLQLFLSVSQIHYHEKRYLKGIKVANKAVKIAKQMGTKDLYAEALLIKSKNEIKRGILSKIEIMTILNEAKRIAEELDCPEILWKIYFEYGNFFCRGKQYLKALDYYKKCCEIFARVGKNIKNKSYRKSYLKRPDRYAVITAINNIEALLN
jgi:tetratricopeptide (TPR) repeat protein